MKSNPSSLCSLGRSDSLGTESSGRSGSAEPSGSKRRTSDESSDHSIQRISDSMNSKRCTSLQPRSSP